MDLIITLVIVILFLIVGYTFGTVAEKNHYKSIQKRERGSRNFPMLTLKDTSSIQNIQSSFLVSGSVVVSVDYFKRFVAQLRNIVGGRMSSYESLLDRGRREAVLRMKEEARRKGGHMIVNLRIETSSIGQNTEKKNNKVSCVEVLAYGTALKLTRPAPVSRG